LDLVEERRQPRDHRLEVELAGGFMNEQRVEKLEALLSRVQENRKRPRPAAGIGLLKPEVARTAPEPAKPLHASLTQTAAGLMPPQQQAVAAPESVRPVAKPGPQPAPAPRAAAPAPAPVKPQIPARQPAPEPAPAPRAAAPEPMRKPAQAGATPLEMAVAGLDMPATARAEPRREPAAPAAPMAPPISPDEAFEPRRIEPEPIREPARPIAQTVSRHSPQVDATFGAMLKRSLSLRPH
jgi:hypothetical protein